MKPRLLETSAREVAGGWRVARERAMGSSSSWKWRERRIQTAPELGAVKAYWGLCAKERCMARLGSSHVK